MRAHSVARFLAPIAIAVVLGPLGPVEETNGRSNLGFMLVAAVFAVNVCWLLTPRFAMAKARGAT